MKRARLRGFKRIAVGLGNAGTADIDALTRALDDDEPRVRKHAAWALARTRHRGDRGETPSRGSERETER